MNKKKNKKYSLNNILFFIFVKKLKRKQIKKELINAVGINSPFVPNKLFLNIADVYCTIDI